MTKEQQFLNNSIKFISELDEYFEKLQTNDITKINILTKSKELVFWLTYYMENIESEE